jgi:NAD(P)-dependent dehydrogenase (short-subunit alcohol dehydrogenase family)
MMVGVFLSAGYGLTAAAQDAGTVLITGSNRGIGLGFVEAYAERGWQVIATCREPQRADALRALAETHDRVSVEALDVTDAAAIAALADKLKGQPIHVLINNAGITGDPRAQGIDGMDLAAYERVLAVNTLGPARISEAFLPNLRAADNPRIINISTSEASFGLDRGPARIAFYRSSKAALNMFMLNYAKMAAADGIAVALVNPGAVDTDMMRGLNMPKRPVSLAVAEVMAIADRLTVEQSGRFFNYDGKVIPW